MFEVVIPVKTSEIPKNDVDATLQRKKCLIVDDTPSIRKMMTRLLKHHHVETSRNGGHGLDMMKQKMYDIVLMDMFMPVMDGLECTKRFREWESVNRNKRQLIYSMSANQDDADESFDGSLPKPIDVKRLGLIIQNL